MDKHKQEFLNKARQYIKQVTFANTETGKITKADDLLWEIVESKLAEASNQKCVECGTDLLCSKCENENFRWQ